MKKSWKKFRNLVAYVFTFWKRTSTRKGVKLSLRKASLPVRFALLTDYEYDDARLCAKFLAAEDRVLELGSAIGFIALYCKTQLGISAFQMVEANPHLKEVVDENFALNGLASPTVLNIAAGPNDGRAIFNISPDYFASSVQVGDHNSIRIDVEQLSIPSIIKRLPFVPNVLIMDIEGGEIEIPTEHLCLFDKIIMELHGRFVGQDKIDAMIAQLVANGFYCAATDRTSVAYLRAANV